MAEYAIQIVFLHLAWSFRAFTEEDGEDAKKVTKLVEKRDKAKNVFYNLALRERTNAAESVRRQVGISSNCTVSS
jgi:cohesin complex subunit SA-1/2